MKKLSLSYTLDEFLYLKWMLEEALHHHISEEEKSREKTLILSILFELHNRIASRVYKGLKKNRLTFKLHEAQAIVIAYENGWIRAKETDEFAKNTLRITYQNLHQKTA